MTTLGILFFGFIIISYFVGMWAGIRLKKPKIIVKKSTVKKRRR
tara:strand:+ start:238 stop:369 length:132 start_codon:yes stop_codon:yes gene_type:complete